jgi:FMN phosphatase YigB (HAD superfamily)
MYSLRTVLFFLLLSIACLHGKALIFDAGFTLIQPDFTPALRELRGVGAALSWFLAGGRKEQLHTNYFYVMDVAGKHLKLPEEPRLLAPDGRSLPSLMTHWMLGTIDDDTALQAIIKAIKAIEKHEKKTGTKIFICASEASLIKLIATHHFTAELNARCSKPVKGMLKLIKECANSCDNYGNRNELFIISNLTTDVFKHWRNNKAIRKILEHFEEENIIISDAVRLLKPHPDIYHHILKKHSLQPCDCIFIDDQQENVKAAQALGITGIVFKDAALLTKRLEELGVFNPCEQSNKVHCAHQDHRAQSYNRQKAPPAKNQLHRAKKEAGA